eukprot:30824-Pelagococcus_subviridis.AAC.8
MSSTAALGARARAPVATSRATTHAATLSARRAVAIAPTRASSLLARVRLASGRNADRVGVVVRAADADAPKTKTRFVRDENGKLVKTTAPAPADDDNR